ncbi:DUF6703 family protein [Fodinicola acaciae]|uniref:DUF6703 family protein n=1 Tax=Fodinicola acaciae TaxID=2681555 RepID=UPI0013D0B438|nr:DUF6703 family protein [Fodinicola acaciae]
MSAEWRAAMQERTAGVALRLSRVPRLLLILIFAALVILGLAGPGLVGAIPLLLIAAFVGWLLLLGWDQRAPVERLIRLAVLLVIVGFAVYKLV